MHTNLNPDSCEDLNEAAILACIDDTNETYASFVLTQDQVEQIGLPDLRFADPTIMYDGDFLALNGRDTIHWQIIPDMVGPDNPEVAWGLQWAIIPA